MKIWIGVKSCAILKGELFGLQKQVEMHGTSETG